MSRQRDIPDDADEKWIYTEHAQAKHEILHRHLGAWLAILGQARRGCARRHKQLVLVDGFAGRGRYMGGEPGSPKIMFDRAAVVVEAGTAQSVQIRCAEPNPNNFVHLHEVCKELSHNHVTIQPRRSLSPTSERAWRTGPKSRSPRRRSSYSSTRTACAACRSTCCAYSRLSESKCY